MPHFFNGVNVLEYTPHDKSKSIKHLFSDSRYVVLDPNTTDLSNVRDNAFNVVVSINNFQNASDYLNQLKNMHRVSSKLIIFSCSTSGNPGNRRANYYKNLTHSDFYNYMDLESMFETYRFEVDHQSSVMYFWAVKKIFQEDLDKV